ncbi:DUF4391 domain-containing protein [Trichococcus shcherbakoviae]|uniref:DUF4391 domain-containing protein n=1 Tax=Trichococcus shcherbakoviae TaxID=2094020 RepID=UPI002AA795FC|nr:DUF4391 domain-containing protein [Trichococcus shcherbakoviae]
MNSKDWIKSLGIPQNAVIDRNLPKQAFYQNADLSLSEKEMIQKGVERARWLGSIKESNTNILKYEDEDICYEEIEYFYIQVSSLEVASKVGRIIFNSIPYPSFLIFTFENAYQFQMALTKKNSNNASLLIVERTYESEWKSNEETHQLTPFHYSNQKTINLKEYYHSLLSTLLSQTIGIPEVRKVEMGNDVIKLYEALQSLDFEIEGLVKQVKSEKQLNKRIELQMKLTKLKKNKEQLLIRTKETEHV